jgi:hypothetical protein
MHVYTARTGVLSLLKHVRICLGEVLSAVEVMDAAAVTLATRQYPHIRVRVFML